MNGTQRKTLVSRVGNEKIDPLLIDPKGNSQAAATFKMKNQAGSLKSVTLS